MKKAVSILLSVTLLLAFFSVLSYADTSVSNLPSTYTITTPEGKKDLITNEYYAKYYDKIFEAEAEGLKNYSLSGMTQTTISAMSDTPVYVTVILKDINGEDYYNYNTATLKDTDIIYAGRTTPFSVVKITREQSETLLAENEVCGIFPAFFSSNPLTAAILGSAVMGDADFNTKITAADARKVLRFSASLESINDSEAKNFYFTSDMNYDGKVNSADARMILRTAAGLEKTINISLPYASYWTDF